MKFQEGNKEAKKRFETPEELQKAVDAYFDKMDQEGKSYNVFRLCYELGFNNYQSLINYESGEGYEEFHEIIQRAKLRILANKQEDLGDRNKSTIGLIFDLKANYGWKDKQEIVHTVQGSEIDTDKLPKEVLQQILKAKEEK